MNAWRQHDRPDWRRGPPRCRHAAGGAQRAACSQPIRSLTPRPIRHIVLTSGSDQSAGGAANLSKAGRYIRVIDSIDPRGHRRAGVDHRPPQRAQPDVRGQRPVGLMADRHLLHAGVGVVLERRGRAVHPRAGCPQRRRHNRVLPPIRRRQHRGHLRRGGLSPGSTPPPAAASTGSSKGLNRVLDIAIPGENQEGGTVIVPLVAAASADETDVANYRDMVTIVRDRVRAMVKKGMTMDQVKHARPTSDYDGLYGGSPRLDVQSFRRSGISQRRWGCHDENAPRHGRVALAASSALPRWRSPWPWRPRGPSRTPPRAVERARGRVDRTSPGNGCQSSLKTGDGE